MYTINKTEFGLAITMGGIYAEGEMANYVREKEALISQMNGEYSLLVDLRDAYPPKQEDAAILIASHQRIAQGKLKRVAVIVKSPVLKANATQVFFRSAINNHMRIIDASRYENWKEQALAWIESGTEPESQLAEPAAAENHR